MKVKMILPALTEATSPYYRPIKYHLFPPLGLAALAGHLSDDDEIILQDEHVEQLNLHDEPNLVIIEVYITNAYRSYEIADHYRAKGAYVCLGGIHVTSLPQEALQHADSIFLGPGEDTWPTFLKDFCSNSPKKVYQSTHRCLADLPHIRRDLFKRHHYLVPNSLVISRGCPHHCDFCYKDAFFKHGKSFYTQPVEQALTEIQSMSGKHLYFLDDNLFANKPYIRTIMSELSGMNRVWQAAGTVEDVLNPGLMELASKSGLSSLFVGFETINSANLTTYNKKQNLHSKYEVAIRKLHSLGIMINASFVFGLYADDPSVFQRTVDWALTNGIQTATFHILTPYPGTRLFDRMKTAGLINHFNWNHYDTRHAVFTPSKMTAQQLENGYWKSYVDFYRYGNIIKSANVQSGFINKLRHLAYVSGWKKFEPLWDWVIRMGWLPYLLPLLETTLQKNSSQKIALSANQTTNAHEYPF